MGLVRYSRMLFELRSLFVAQWAVFKANKAPVNRRVEKDGVGPARPLLLSSALEFEFEFKFGFESPLKVDLLSYEFFTRIISKNAKAG